MATGLLLGRAGDRGRSSMFIFMFMRGLPLPFGGCALDLCTTVVPGLWLPTSADEYTVYLRLEGRGGITGERAVHWCEYAREAHVRDMGEGQR